MRASVTASITLMIELAYLFVPKTVRPSIEYNAAVEGRAILDAVYVPQNHNNLDNSHKNANRAIRNDRE